MPHVTLAKQLVLQHGAECRGKRHGKLERHTLVHQALHHAHQWDVTLGYRFEEPVFFQEMLMFWMANERKMRVKNQRERAGRHCGFRNAECGLIPLLARVATRNCQFAILERPAKILKAVQSLFDYDDAGGVAEPDRTIVTERSSRNDRDVGFTQQAIGEIL